MLQLRDVFRQLLRDLRAQKLRTFLTVFGIVWGTVAIALLLAFGTGMHKRMIKNTAGLGDRIVIGWPGLTSLTWEGLGKGRRIRITEEDLAAVKIEAKGLRGLSAEYTNSFKLHYGTKTLAVDTSGVTPEFGRMRNMIPDEGGRFINDLDEGRQRRVVFIGNELAKDVFGESPAVGKTVILNGSPFTVVGVLKKKEQDSSYGGRDSGNAYIPASTYRAITGEKYIDNFIFQGEKNLDSKVVIQSVRESLGGRLRFNPEDKEALSFWDTTEQFKFFDMFMLSFNIFLGVIGSLTLIVGGIGVSNIMNVVIEERTREIGIKMALGAKQRSILMQFLLETLIVTAVGGAIGFGISIGICAIFPKLGLEEYVGNPSVSPLVAGLTAGILGVVGLVAGYFPARDAARLDPVVAMKL